MDFPDDNALPSVRDLFAHPLESENGPIGCEVDTGGAGTSMRIQPHAGSGGLWYFTIDDAAAFFSCSLSLDADAEIAHPALDCFFFGAGCMPAPDGPHAPDCTKRSLIGRILRSSAPPKARIGAHAVLEATGAVLLPRAVKNLSLACRCDPLVLASAISSLDGSQAIPELSRVFDDVRTARPCPVTAHAYYRGKLLEAAALLVDWQIRRTHCPAASLKKADRIALDRVIALMESSYGRALSTDELCRTACMSATKLASLFREAKGTTPQEYLRDLRMQEACRLLASTDLTMAEIAAAIGYARQSSFSEAFKSCHGISPRAYRTVRGPR